MKLFKTAILFSLALCYNKGAFSQSIPNEVIGRWSGQVVEEGRSDYYTVNLNVNAGEAGGIAATIDYPDYGCGGNLKLIEITQAELTEVAFLELLSYGNDLCIDEGEVVIARENGRLRFQWSKSGLDFFAQGYLDRQ